MFIYIEYEFLYGISFPLSVLTLFVQWNRILDALTSTEGPVSLLFRVGPTTVTRRTFCPVTTVRGPGGRTSPPWLLGCGVYCRVGWKTPTGLYTGLVGRVLLLLTSSVRDPCPETSSHFTVAVTGLSSFSLRVLVVSTLRDTGV